MRRIRPASLGVASQSLWRIATPLPAALHKSHQNGGRVFLIFVADPTGSPAPREASVGTTRRVEEGLRGDDLEPTRDRTDRYRGSYSQKLLCRPWLDVARPRQARACSITMLMPTQLRRIRYRVVLQGGPSCMRSPIIICASRWSSPVRSQSAVVSTTG